VEGRALTADRHVHRTDPVLDKGGSASVRGKEVGREGGCERVGVRGGGVERGLHDVLTHLIGELFDRRGCGTHYRGTSLIRNSAPLGPYSRTMHRPLWWS